MTVCKASTCDITTCDITIISDITLGVRDIGNINYVTLLTLQNQQPCHVMLSATVTSSQPLNLKKPDTTCLQNRTHKPPGTATMAQPWLIFFIFIFAPLKGDSQLVGAILPGLYGP